MPDAPDLPWIKPSDAKSWSLRPRRVRLDNKGDFDLQTVDDPFEQLVVELGLAHEQAVLEWLSDDMGIHTISSPDDTARLMADRVPAIYQVRLLTGRRHYWPTGLPHSGRGDGKPYSLEMAYI